MSDHERKARVLADLVELFREPPPEPDGRLSYAVGDDLQAVIGIAKTKQHEEINAGRLVARKAGRRTLVTRAEALEWLRSLPRAKSVL